MTRPVVLLDCDGPLSDFAGAYLRAMANVLGIEPPSTDLVDNWWIHECPFFVETAAAHGFANNLALKRLVDARVTRVGFCDAIEVQPGAREAVGEIMELADIYVVTAPWHASQHWMYERTWWLLRHFGIPASRVIHSTDKSPVHGDAFVDDKPSHVLEWGARWPKGSAHLFGMLHNRSSHPEIAGSTWSDVITAAKERANQ